MFRHLNHLPFFLPFLALYSLSHFACSWAIVFARLMLLRGAAGTKPGGKSGIESFIASNIVPVPLW